MSNLTQLAVRAARVAASFDFAISLEVTDATGTTSVPSHMATVAGRKTNEAQAISRMDKVLASAHAGAVIAITLPDISRTVTLAAPGGAFDARSVTTPLAPPDVPNAPTETMRLLTPGVALTEPTKAIWIGGVGQLEVRTSGTPNEMQPGFTVSPMMLPVAIIELGANTTATPIHGFF